MPGLAPTALIIAAVVLLPIAILVAAKSDRLRRALTNPAVWIALFVGAFVGAAVAYVLTVMLYW